MTKTEEKPEVDDLTHKLDASGVWMRPPLGMGWYAVKTKPLAEVRLIAELKRLKLDTYRPVSTHYLRKRSGKVKVRRPIFAGYIFVCCSIAEDYERVREADGFSHFVKRAGTDNPFRFPDMKIGDLMMRQRFGDFDDEAPKPEKYQPKKGDRVLVTSGEWYGWFAEVLGLVGKKKRAKVRFDGRVATNEIEISKLTPEAA